MREVTVHIRQAETGEASVEVRLPKEIAVVLPELCPCPLWRFLSPLTLRVLRLMCGSGWMSKDRIAAALSEPPEGRLAVLLPDLAARGVLESSTSKGYHLAIADSADPETYRRDLAAWLDGQEGTPGSPAPAAGGKF